MSDFIFFTTPIYYTNDVPHVGHAYSSIIADVMSRSYRMLGREVKFCTWVDENSQKALLKAQELDMPIAQYLDLMASKHKDIRDGLTISYTDFIRTTETRHHDYVQKILNQTHQAGDIYQWVYEGLYCVGCEWFKKSSDLTTEWLCPDHLKAPTIIHENNRFFALSKYQNQLTAMYQQHPDFVIPQSRFTEVKTFVWQGLEDFSASRQTNTFGIPLPRDPDQVTYMMHCSIIWQYVNEEMRNLLTIWFTSWAKILQDFMLSIDLRCWWVWCLQTPVFEISYPNISLRRDFSR